MTETRRSYAAPAVVAYGEVTAMTGYFKCSPGSDNFVGPGFVYAEKQEGHTCLNGDDH